MTRAWLVLGAAMVVSGCPAHASQLLVPPGPMFYTATGEASVFATPMLFCTDAYADPMRDFYLYFVATDSLAEYPECWVPSMQANLILVREGSATLPAIGSAATVPVRLAAMHLGPGFILNSCVAESHWGVQALLSRRRASTGTLTLRRTSDAGGTFDLQCSVYVAFDFQRYHMGYPWDRFGADLGPYVVRATGASWTTQPASAASGRVPCPACAGSFFGSATRLSGVGDSLGDERNDSIRLQNSEFSLRLTPACVAPTAVQGNAWGGVKALYR